LKCLYVKSKTLFIGLIVQLVELLIHF